MATAKLLEKNALVMRFHQATAKHPENGEEIDISFAGCAPAITYKDRIVIWDIRELINEAVELIDKETEED
ncbi:hypothetical protein [Streptococcus intermedius]